VLESADSTDSIWKNLFANEQSLLLAHGDSLISRCISLTLESFYVENSSQTLINDLRVLQTLAPHCPRSVCANLSLIVPLLERNTTSTTNVIEMSSVQDLLLRSLAPVLEQIMQGDGDDSLPTKLFQQLRQTVKQVFFTCPLINLPSASKLLCTLDQSNMPSAKKLFCTLDKSNLPSATKLKCTLENSVFCQQVIMCLQMLQSNAQASS